MARKPTATVDIRQVIVKRKEALIVSFHKGDDLEPELVQFEARVNDKGEIELFCDEPLTVKPFSEWSHWPEG